MFYFYLKILKDEKNIWNNCYIIYIYTVSYIVNKFTCIWKIIKFEFELKKFYSIFSYSSLIIIYESLGIFIHLVKNMQNISNTYLHKNPINLMLKNKQEDILNVSIQFQIFDHESKDHISSENFFICSAHRRTSIFRASSSA